MGLHILPLQPHRPRSGPAGGERRLRCRWGVHWAQRRGSV